MTNEARREAVRALARLEASRDYQDRADAGRAMASFAELPEAREPLQKLLLDARDTFVTRATAEACFDVRMRPAWRQLRRPSLLPTPTMPV